jgi:hypothetical protein
MLSVAHSSAALPSNSALHRLDSNQPARTRHSNRHSSCRTAPRFLKRGFLPWRLSDAGRRICRAVSQAAGIRNPSQKRRCSNQSRCFGLAAKSWHLRFTRTPLARGRWAPDQPGPAHALRRVRRTGHRPLNCGLRFSMNACRPSRKSSESMQAVLIALIASMSRSSLSFNT